MPKVYYAHRGLHDNISDAPENSLAAFQKAVDAGYGIELDVQMTADGKDVYKRQQTYTSHAHNKRMNRKMELLYREAEYFTVLRALLGNDLSLAEQEKLTAGWKHILTNQFHDIIPGSSIFEVYEDSKKDYEWIATQGEEVEAGFFARCV